MKNVKLFLSLIVLIVSFQFANGQEIAMVTAPKSDVITTTNSVEKVLIDRTAITEISDYIRIHVNFPVDPLEYANEAHVKIQVSINAFGEIIDTRFVEGNKRVGKEVLKTLASLERVSPILINGVPTSQTIQLPLIFK